MIVMACKWVSFGLALLVFFGLLSVAGNVHVAEFFGSLFIALMVGGAFYLTVCRNKKERKLE